MHIHMTETPLSEMDVIATFRANVAINLSLMHRSIPLLVGRNGKLACSCLLLQANFSHKLVSCLISAFE